MSLPDYDWLDISKARNYIIACTGWFALIDRLFAEIDGKIGRTPVKLQLVQIKETFGELRFYYRLENAWDGLFDELEEIVGRRMKESKETCIECGASGSLRNNGGWIAPMCGEHARGREVRS